ncbi:MAG: radical SAM protein [Rhodospirillales bacterium]|jgi:radical SAM protein with 4Fe4S-binding SPASM domain|nr:radical SAM protein [Rhodospirillales bacterium]
MFDIDFFKQAQSIKDRIISGEATRADVLAIEQELDGLRAKSPHVFNVETTNHCNMTCVMCPRTTLMTRENQWIDKEAFENILDQMAPHKEEDLNDFWKFIKETYGITFEYRSENAFYFYIVSRCLILHGYGEPLVDKNIVERVQACTDRNIPTYFSCVPANLSVKRAEEVMKAGLSVLKFSMDGLTNEQQKSVRGRLNDFDKSYQTMLDVIEMREKKGYKTLIVPTMIALSEDDDTKEMHQKFLDMWKGYDVFAYVKSQDNRWYFEDDDEMDNNSHYQEQYCEYPWSSMTVMADGSVVPCTQDYNCEMKLGDIHDNSLQEIWNGDAYEKFRHWHITGNFPEGHKCATRCDQVKLFNRLKDK